MQQGPVVDSVALPLLGQLPSAPAEGVDVPVRLFRTW